MKKKRTSLESLFEGTNLSVEKTKHDDERTEKKSPLKLSSNRPYVKQQTVYLPLSVYEQLRKLAFEERQKMHDYILEGLDLIFKKKGLPSIKELKNRIYSEEI